jgi:hypothetical protein
VSKILPVPIKNINGLSSGQPLKLFTAVNVSKCTIGYNFGF